MVCVKRDTRFNTEIEHKIHQHVSIIRFKLEIELSTTFEENIQACLMPVLEATHQAIPEAVSSMSVKTIHPNDVTSFT